jgi:hypothetical protein
MIERPVDAGATHFIYDDFAARIGYEEIFKK